MENAPTPPPIPALPMVEYRSFDAARSPGRPAGVTVVAILGIVLGVLEALRSSMAAYRYLYLGFLRVSNPNSYGTYRMRMGIVFSIYILSTLFAGLLLVGSIASLRLARWARRGMLVWAGCFVGLTIAWIVYRYWSYWSVVASRRLVPLPAIRSVIVVLRSLLADYLRMAGLALAGFVFPFFISRRTRAAFALKAATDQSIRNYERTSAATTPAHAARL